MRLNNQPSIVHPSLHPTPIKKPVESVAGQTTYLNFGNGGLSDCSLLKQVGHEVDDVIMENYMDNND